jgi:hypothetical protein
LLKSTALTACRFAGRAIFSRSRKDYRYIFILGHMRSGSSLLARILASHPDFDGAGETHVIYKTDADFSELLYETCRLQRRLTVRGKYIVDQINHDINIDDDSFLNSKLLFKCIILKREPVGALKSAMRLLNCDERAAAEYYNNRLRTLIRYGEILQGRAALIDYEDLVANPDRTLKDLSSYFGLETPFAKTYTTNRTTGTGKSGDPSQNIKVGRIIKTAGYSDISISEDCVQQSLVPYRFIDEQLTQAIRIPFDHSIEQVGQLQSVNSRHVAAS